MVTIDIKEKQKELLEEHYISIMEKINEFHDKNQGFILRDLISDKQHDNYYYRYLTKGILMPLLDLGYIKIISCYNGYKNFTYLPLKKIEGVK